MKTPMLSLASFAKRRTANRLVLYLNLKFAWWEVPSFNFKTNWRQLAHALSVFRHLGGTDEFYSL